MNEQEQKAADALLGKLKTSSGEEAANLATAYQALTQGAFNRKNAECREK